MDFDVFEYTGRGGRTVNEDSVGHITAENTGGFLVADGLGGHALGEVASATVKDTVLKALGSFDMAPEDAITESVKTANEVVLDIQRDKNQILKSTLALLLIMPLDIYMANVGDSRVYMLRDGEITEYTNDHSVAFKKYKAGEITREEIGFDEDQSSLLRTIGNEERYEPEIHHLNIVPRKGDAFLLCSDGFWEYVNDMEITMDLAKATSAEDWAVKLLKRAMDRVNGDNDNITVQTVIIN